MILLLALGVVAGLYIVVAFILANIRYDAPFWLTFPGAFLALGFVAATILALTSEYQRVYP